MRCRISIRGCVRPFVCPSVRPVLFSKVKSTHTRCILFLVSGLVLWREDNIFLTWSNSEQSCDQIFAFQELLAEVDVITHTLISILGTFTNIMSIIVWIRPPLKNSSLKPLGIKRRWRVHYALRLSASKMDRLTDRQ